MAENPPCAPWCGERHDVDEFRIGGGITCVRRWPSGLVTVDRSWFATEDAWYEPQVTPVVISTMLVEGQELDCAAAELVAAELLEAVAFVRGLSR